MIIKDREVAKKRFAEAKKGELLIISDFTMLGNTVNEMVLSLIVIRTKGIELQSIKEDFNTLRDGYKFTEEHALQINRAYLSLVARRRYHNKKRREKNGKKN